MILVLTRLEFAGREYRVRKRLRMHVAVKEYLLNHRKIELVQSVGRGEARDVECG